MDTMAAPTPQDVSVSAPGEAADAKRYHHGDLQRALVEAAQRILERDGPAALSLRAVAREAGVSPAAPYHHFKDKGELLEAVAHEGFEALGVAMAATRPKDDTPPARLTALGVAYVRFARANPSLYRVMFDCSRDKDALPMAAHEHEHSPYSMIREALVEAGADPADEAALELALISCWCAAHGLAEMGGFNQFEPLKTLLGGEEAFLEGVLSRLGLFQVSR